MLGYIEPRWNKIAWTYLQLPMMVVLGVLSKTDPGNSARHIPLPRNVCLKIEYFLLMTWKRSAIIEVNDWTVNKSGKNNGKFWFTYLELTKPAIPNFGHYPWLITIWTFSNQQNFTESRCGLWICSHRFLCRLDLAFTWAFFLKNGRPFLLHFLTEILS